MKFHRQSAVMAMILFFCGALSLACATEKVETDGKTVRLNESKCSLTFESLDELSEEEAGKFDIVFDPSKRYWKAEFSHTGDHELAALVLQPAKGGFYPDSQFVYTSQDGKRIELLAGNVGGSRAWMVTDKDDRPRSAAVEHKGYRLTYDFDDNVWTYEALGEQ